MSHLKPGQSKPLNLYRADGNLGLVVTVYRDHEGVTINATHHDTLNRTFTNDRLDEGRTYLQFLYDAIRSGLPLWAVEAQAGVLTSAAAIVDQAERDMIDGISERMQQATPQPVDVADIRDGADRNWRHHLRAQLVTQAAQQSGVRVIHPTRTNVHVKPLTPAELDRVRNHDDGTVTLLPGQSWLVLRAIYRRIGGTPTYRPGTQIMTALRLNRRGLTVAETTERAA